MNPYLTNNTYVQDLSNQDKFLKPVSTNSDKEIIEN